MSWPYIIIVTGCFAIGGSSLVMAIAHAYTILGCKLWKTARAHAAMTALYLAVATFCILAAIRFSA
jgi:hypothetical protein